MKRLILTGYDDRMACVGDITAPRMLAYAQRLGVSFECNRCYEADSHPSWQKLQLLWDRQPYFDEIAWLDADSFLTNPEVDVFARHAECGGAFVVSRDWGPCEPAMIASHFSMGNFLFRTRHPRACWILEAALMRLEWANRGLWEQSALQELAREQYGADFDVVNCREFNAVPAELRRTIHPWTPGDFLAHLTSDHEAERLAWIQKWETQWSLC